MDKGNNEITVNRTFKSRIFAMLYRDKEGILSEFLSQNRMEAKSMSIYEYDAEKHIRQETPGQTVLKPASPKQVF